MATDDKYDRQIRLWGPHGQERLATGKVLALGATPAVTETLKNLVLPGMGFLIVDEADVTLADCANNFFVTSDDVGKPRATAVAQWLAELNPDVTGAGRVGNPMTVLAEDPGLVAEHQLVLASGLGPTAAKSLGALCEQHRVPLILMWGNGFQGRIRAYYAEHCVLETHPESELGDLRLTDPFPELSTFVEKFNLSTMDEQQHAHVPYVALLLQAQKALGKVPASKEDKEAFKAQLGAWRKSPTELNFDEALANAYKAWTPYCIPEAVQSVLDEASGQSLDGPNASFWLAARAVQLFVQSCGKLPLAGNVPDMASDTESFIQLQALYAARAAGDRAAIEAHAHSIAPEVAAADPSAVQLFCRHSQGVEVFRTRTLREEYESPNAEEIASELGDDESQVMWYFVLRACEAFQEAHGRHPGGACGDSDDAALAAEATLLGQQLHALVPEGTDLELGAEPKSSWQKACEEMVRCGGAQLHSTAAVLGGVAAQEAVKLVTRQFSPLNNTWIYNGLEGKAQSIEL